MVLHLFNPTKVSSQKSGERKADPLAGFRTEASSPSDDQHSQATLPPVIEMTPTKKYQKEFCVL